MREFFGIEGGIVRVHKDVPESAQFLEGHAQVLGEERRPDTIDAQRQAANQLGVPTPLVVHIVLKGLCNAKGHLLDDVIGP